MTCQIKTGDLVQMKYIMWWRLQDRKDFTENTALAVGTDANCINLLFSNDTIVRNLAEHWEVVSETRRENKGL
jgi:hypothetical protein